MRRSWMRFAVTIPTILLAVAAARPARAQSDEQTIRRMYAAWDKALARKDLNGITSIYQPSETIVMYDAVVPRQFTGIKAIRKDYVDFLAGFPGPVKILPGELRIVTAGSMAYAYGVDHWSLSDKARKKTDMVFRFTDVWQKINGKWLVVHEHVSFPADPATGMADFMSKP